MGQDIAAIAARASALSDVGRHEEALSLARSAYSPDADHPDLCRAITVALLRLERIGEALAFTEAVLARNPKSVTNLVNRRSALQQAGYCDRAVEAARAALRLRPDSTPLRWILADTLTVQGTNPALREASALLESVLGAGPDNVEYLASAALVRARLRDGEGFREFVNRGLAVNPHHERLLAIVGTNPSVGKGRRLSALRGILGFRPLSSTGRLAMAQELWGEWSKVWLVSWCGIVLFLVSLAVLPGQNAAAVEGLVVPVIVWQGIAEFRIRKHFPRQYVSRAVRSEPLAAVCGWTSPAAWIAAWALAGFQSSPGLQTAAAGLAILAALLCTVAASRVPRAVARTASVSRGSEVSAFLRMHRKQWWLAARLGAVASLLLSIRLSSVSQPLFGAAALLASAAVWIAVLPDAVMLMRQSAGTRAGTVRATVGGLVVSLVLIVLGVVGMVTHPSSAGR